MINHFKIKIKLKKMFKQILYDIQSPVFTILLCFMQDCISPDIKIMMKYKNKKCLRQSAKLRPFPSSFAEGESLKKKNTLQLIFKNINFYYINCTINFLKNSNHNEPDQSYL